jgi:hypothetical protein
VLKKYGTIAAILMFILSYRGENILSYDTGAGNDGWDVREGIPVHQYITKEAIAVWEEAPPEAVQEINSYASKSVFARLDYAGFADYDRGYDDIITGSGDEDYVTTFYLPFGEYCTGDALNGFFEHFWNPDGPHVGEYNGSPGIPVVTGQSSLSHRAKLLEILG